MAYNFINRFSFNQPKRPFLAAVLAMLLVIVFGLSIFTNNEALWQLIRWICAGVAIVVLGLGLLWILTDK